LSAYREGIADRSSLSDDDLQRFDALLGMAFTGWNQEHQFVADGVVGHAVWQTRTRSLRRLVGQPGWVQWWSEWGDM
jgi:hypothetical protein